MMLKSQKNVLSHQFVLIINKWQNEKSYPYLIDVLGGLLGLLINLHLLKVIELHVREVIKAHLSCIQGEVCSVCVYSICTGYSLLDSSAWILVLLKR